MTCLNAFNAALKRLLPFAGRGFSRNSPPTSAVASGIAKPMNPTPLPEETLRAVLLRRGLVLHRGCREKAEAFADKSMILRKGPCSSA